jgi:hypothetical protein
LFRALGMPFIKKDTVVKVKVHEKLDNIDKNKTESEVVVAEDIVELDNNNDLSDETDKLES